MPFFVCSQDGNIELEIMWSFIKFTGNGRYQHTITFLAKNASDTSIERLVLIYPATILDDAYESLIHNFSDVPLVKQEDCDKVDGIDIRRDEARNVHGYNYRRLALDGVSYEGYITVKPSITRVPAGLDLLSTLAGSGYTLLSVTLDHEYPLVQGYPQWFRIGIGTDSANGLLYRQFQAATIGEEKRGYHFYDPHVIESRLVKEISDYQGPAGYITSADEIKHSLSFLIKEERRSTVSRLVFYVMYDRVDELSPMRCKIKDGDKVITGEGTVGGTCPVSKIALDAVAIKTKFMISVYTKEKLINWLSLLGILSRIAGFFKGCL